MARQVHPSGTQYGGDELRRLADELDATPEQIEEAIAAVGPSPADIEMHLKGTRSTTNSDRVRDAGG